MAGKKPVKRHGNKNEDHVRYKKADIEKGTGYGHAQTEKFRERGSDSRRDRATK